MLISSLLTIMLQSLRKASRSLIRDFSEVGYLQNSSRISSFIKSSYLNSGRAIADELRHYYKDHKIIFDNDNETHNKSDYIWFINPMDSRTNFANSLAFYTTSVALIHNNEAIAAVIDAPIIKETFYAEKGRGAFSEDSQARHMKMRVGNKKSLQMTVIDCSILNNNPDNTATAVNINEKLRINNVIMRSMGSVNLGYAYLGSARYDALIYANTMMHKYKASMGMLFAKESGGVASFSNNVFIAGNKILHDSLYSQLCTNKK